MTDLNEVCISGMILREPSLRKTKTDHDMCSLQVCVKRPEPSKAHDYLDVVLWEDKAQEFVTRFHAGDRVFLKGRLKKTNYTGLDGVKRVTTQIIAEQAEPAEYAAQADYPEINAPAVYAENLA